ncbi:hypothetical protein [Aurantiacibacter poecillastricola]|uniref:hypothetical protein n=1 Tax=Aurantiacibacter poecillastricola TaxID=3064385 RepID=UPI00273F1051|nr:hypothetical protein [Aurantiacibacter sp. 219JJ12-13]MDP5263472.1 hypothetical protein [Aurantiacibacter sp. 219JJ12-13]
MGSRISCAVACIFPLLFVAAPAAANEAAQVPEASGMLLFALGTAGVLIGRSLSMGPRNKD